MVNPIKVPFCKTDKKLRSKVQGHRPSVLICVLHVQSVKMPIMCSENVNKYNTGHLCNSYSVCQTWEFIFTIPLAAALILLASVDAAPTLWCKQQKKRMIIINMHHTQFIFHHRQTTEI